MFVEAGGDLVEDEVRHGGVDFTGELDEAGVEIELFGFPGEIEGVDGDAVAAEAGAGIEGREAEGLGLGGIDDFVDVDAHAHAKLLELIDQGDVDAAVDVFEEFGHLGDRWRANRNDASKYGAVHGSSEFGSDWAAAADDFWDVVPGDGFVSWVFALGAEGDMNSWLVGSAGHFQSEQVSGFETGDDELFGGAGVGGALENDELALFDMGRDGLDGAGDVAEVGLVILVERGGDADDDGVHLSDLRIIRGGAETGFLRLLDGFWEDADDVGAASVEGVDLFLGDVEAGDAEAFVAEEQGQRKADVAHADDADAGFAGLHFELEEFETAGGDGGHDSLIVKGRASGIYPACVWHCAIPRCKVWSKVRRFPGCMLGIVVRKGVGVAKYLVTGAAGFIGRSIAAALIARGDSVRGVDNFSTGKRENLVGLEAMEFLEGDLADAEVCQQASVGVEVVFHEAALPSVPRSVLDPIASNTACVDATVNLLWAAKEAGVRRVVYAASSSAYGDTPTLPKREEMLPNPISPYAVAKLAGEYYMRSFSRVYGLETVALRYFNVFGPYQDPTSQYSGVLAVFCRKMLAGEQPTIYGDGETSRDFTYIQNTVEANLLAASAPAVEVSGRVTNVATGVRITLNEVVAALREITGYDGPVAYAPERSGDIKHSLADISLAERLLGYRPSVDFREGLARTVAWYRTAGNQG